VLRGIAVLAVMVYHCDRNVPSLHLSYLFHYGWTGVDLFFVLSGFLITGILLRSKQGPGYFANFYARRALRIWPLYFGLLVFGFVAVPLLQPHLQPTVAQQCHPWQSYLLFVQNLVVPQSGSFGPLQITWSLCVEEQFYLLWPLVVLFCSTGTLKKLAMGAGILSLLLRLAAAHGWLAIDGYHNTLCRFDGLALGSLAAIILPELDARSIRRWAVGLGGLAIAGIAITVSTGVAKWSFIGLISLLFCATMCLAIGSPRFPKARALAFTGRISYGLYLLHALAFDIVRDRHVRSLVALTHNVVVNDLLLFVCSMALAFGLAFASWKLLESPALSLKRYFEPHPGKDLDENAGRATAAMAQAS
jgi:peptidoglycan/LPS O-acetylase OafA/YrhL